MVRRASGPATGPNDPAVPDEPVRGLTRRSALRWSAIGLGAAAVLGAGGVGVRGAANGAFTVGAG